MVIIKGYKIRLLPTLEQKILIQKSIGVSRFVYNWCLGKQFKSDKFIRDNELRKELTKLKRTNDYHWLNEVGNNVIKQAAKDLCNAYQRFLNKASGKPRFKKKGVHNSFYVNYESMKKTKRGVRCEKIGDIKTSERLPKLMKNKHYMNPHVVFDGKYYYITFGFVFICFKICAITSTVQPLPNALYRLLSDMGLPLSVAFVYPSGSVCNRSHSIGVSFRM